MRLAIRSKFAIHSVCLALAFSSLAFGQAEDEKKVDANQPDKLPAFAYFSVQLAKTDGSKIFLENDVPIPNSKPVAQTYTVKVPVQEQVEVNGKIETTTRYITETRTRMTRPTKRVSVPVPKSHAFKDANGKTLSKNEVIGKLGMGSGRYVVILQSSNALTPQLKKLFSKDTVFVYVKPPQPELFKR